MVDAVAFWDKIAPKYAKSPIKDMNSYEMTLAQTQSYLRDGDRVLEIGAGTGSTALLLAGNVAEITATDISTAMLNVGRQNAEQQGVSNVRFLEAAADAHVGENYDAVLAHNILHLVEDLPGTLLHLHRQMRPGGLLISKTFLKPKSGLHLEYRFMKVLLPIMQLFGRAPYVGFHTIDSFHKMIQGAGFEIVESDNYPAGQPRRYVVARRL